MKIQLLGGKKTVNKAFRQGLELQAMLLAAPYHRIDMIEAQPIRQTMRRLPLAKQADVCEIFDDMQQCGVIKESDSPWSFPVVLVWKNGDVRFCVNYRKLNNVTK
jgi:hypothetical protein